MASNTREDRVIHAVPCPTCRASVGFLCTLNRNSLESNNRPILHQARRDAWREWKKQTDQNYGQKA